MVGERRAGDGARQRSDPARLSGAAAIALWLVSAALVVGTVVHWSLGPRPSAGRSLEALRTSVDPVTGERVARFSGFAVAIDTHPPGARILIDGIERGEAPVVAGIECAPGDEVEIRATRAGAGEATAVTRCRVDTLVKLTLRLRR